MIKYDEIQEGFRMTELGLLPMEWRVVRLKDVSGFKNGINFTKEQKGESGVLTIDVLNMYSEGIYVNPKNLYRVDKEINDDYLLKNGDILFVRSSLKREGVGWASLYRETDEPATFCGFIIRARLKSKDVLSEFLTYFLRGNIARKKLIASSGKVAITNINQGMLGKVTFPLPPLPEQRKITSVLSTAQQAKEKTEEIIKATKELKKSLMKHLFTYGPVPVEEAENVPLKETEIGMVPEGWEVVRLGDICKTKTGGTPSRKNSNYYKGDIPWVKSGELEDNFINLTEEKISEFGLKNSSAKIFPKGTLLIALYGATVGKTAILNIDASTNQAICAIFPNDNSLSTEFLRYYLVFARNRLLEERYGGAQPNISQTVIRNTKIPLPYLPPQQKIANILSNVDKKIETEKNKKISLEGLFRTLLNNLMTAKIRVNHLEVET